MSSIDILLLLFIVLLVGLALLWHIKRKKAGKGCGGVCSGCSHSASCSSNSTSSKSTTPH